MSSFFDDPDSDEEIPSHRSAHAGPAQRSGPIHQNAIASSSRAPSLAGTSTSLAGTHEDSHSRSRSRTHASAQHDHEHDRSYSIISETDASPGRSDRTPFSLGLGIGDDESMNGDRYGRGGVGLGDGDQGSELDLDFEDEENDVKRMGRIWVKERGTVEIMPWEGDLIDGLFDKLEQQQKMVQTLRSDPQTSEEEHFKLMLVQTEMERVKFLVRSYVRTRLHKIEKYSHYITLTPEIHHLLSGAELQHAKRYTELLHTHYQHSVLDSLPEWLRRMDDKYGDGLSMVSAPNRNIPVLIHCRKDCGEIVLEGGERAALAKGTTHLVKYRLVEQWIKLGWAEVI